MNKKELESIAYCINIEYRYIKRIELSEGKHCLQSIDNIIEGLLIELPKYNSNFDADKFIRACKGLK